MEHLGSLKSCESGEKVVYNNDSVPLCIPSSWKRRLGECCKFVRQVVLQVIFYLLHIWLNNVIGSADNFLSTSCNEFLSNIGVLTLPFFVKDTSPNVLPTVVATPAPSISWAWLQLTCSLPTTSELILMIRSVSGKSMCLKTNQVESQHNGRYDSNS